MPKDPAQIKLDCAILQQAISDLQTWKAPFVPPKRDERPATSRPVMWPESDVFMAFNDAARWMFDLSERRQWHFSLRAICGRLDVDARKLSGAAWMKLTPHQRAWIEALGMRGGSVSGRS